MTVSAFELFKIGIGPSSSHTVGPMVAAKQFVDELTQNGQLSATASVQVTLYSSLGATGEGHGTLPAVVAGLERCIPDTVAPERVSETWARVSETKRIRLGDHEIGFDPATDLILKPMRRKKFHPNAMTFCATDTSGENIHSRTLYSVGGGFITDGEAEPNTTSPVKFPYRSGSELLAMCDEHQLSIAEIAMANERATMTPDGIKGKLLHIAKVMNDSIDASCERDGILPGGLNVKRRAKALKARLAENPTSEPGDWVTLWAIAVNEENASGGRIVTAPTNGAGGIIPAVLRYYQTFDRSADEDGVVDFLLVAAAIGSLYKMNASISGAEVGCQGEVGSACSMAAAGLAHVRGGTTAQVENAAEIAMEHNLGLTCDPIGGLVQVPCIERNALAATKAIVAARLALNGDGSHMVSLDEVIETLRSTGADMKSKYKETARGGLAVNVADC